MTESIAEVVLVEHELLPHRRLRTRLPVLVVLAALIAGLIWWQRQDPPDPLYLLPVGGETLGLRGWDRITTGGPAIDADTQEARTTRRAVFTQQDSTGDYAQRIEVTVFYYPNAAHYALPKEQAWSGRVVDVSPISHIIDFHDPTCGPESMVHVWILGDTVHLRSFVEAMRCDHDGIRSGLPAFRELFDVPLQPLWSMHYGLATADADADKGYVLTAYEVSDASGDWWVEPDNVVTTINGTAIYAPFRGGELYSAQEVIWRRGRYVFRLTSRFAMSDETIAGFVGDLRPASRRAWLGAVNLAPS